MIFLSYTHKDKEIIDVIAQKLSVVFGQDAIFFDAWSIQPGDSIVGKMEDGLRAFKFFFFFVSKNSLSSSIVKLEWQNALLKATKGEARLIPVKLDDCLMPQVLLQTLYIDIYGQGLETGISQMIEVIKGHSTYQPKQQTYENLRGYVKGDGKEIIIEFRAETYSEPISRFLVLVDNKKEDIQYTCISEGHYGSDFKEDLELSTGSKTNALFISVDRATSPGFPIIVKLTPKNGVAIILNGLMRAVSQSQFRTIPIVR